MRSFICGPRLLPRGPSSAVTAGMHSHLQRGTCRSTWAPRPFSLIKCIAEISNIDIGAAVPDAKCAGPCRTSRSDSRTSWNSRFPQISLNPLYNGQSTFVVHVVSRFGDTAGNLLECGTVGQTNGCEQVHACGAFFATMMENIHWHTWISRRIKTIYRTTLSCVASHRGSSLMK